jgi:hypothetical protein
MTSDLFEGATYVPSLDRERLGEQLCRVIDAMADGHWRTLREISRITDDPEASISARLRDCRKLWGTNAMESRRRASADPKRGVWEYKVHVPIDQGLPLTQI